MANNALTNKQKANVKHNLSKNLAGSAVGIITSCFGNNADILDSDENIINCKIKKTVPPLVVGDRVAWVTDPHDIHQGIIISLAPRKNLLSRLTIIHRQQKFIAANIDQLIITIAPKPEVNWGLVDHYILAARAQKITPVILLNKIDLEHENILNILKKFYATLDVPVLLISEKNLALDKQLAKILHNKISILVGQSGVGKSSIMKRLLPDKKIKIGTAINQHTTSISTLYILEKNSFLIDSPGIRELDIGEIKKSDLDRGFPDIKHFSVNCKFRNCNHVNTPECAIQEKIKDNHSNDICLHRLEHYLKLLKLV